MRKPKRLPGMLMSVIGAAVMLPTAQAAQFGAIVGMVRDAAAVPVAQATVTAVRVDGSGTRATLSGSDGVYSFADMAPGAWSVSAELDGYPQATTPALVVVAGGLIEQCLMVQRQQRAPAVGLQRHRHQRFAFRGRMPGPAEHQFFVRHHLVIDPADFMILSVAVGEADTKSPADPRIDNGVHRAGLDLRRPEPARYFFRVGPRRVDFLRRRMETAFEGEARARDEAGVAGCA